MGFVFNHCIQMGRRLGVWMVGKSLSGLYLRNHKMYEVETLFRDIGWGM